MALWSPNTLGQIEDGAAAWSEFIDGVAAAFDSNESALPAIGIVLAVVVVMAVNVRVSWWLARRIGSRGRGGSSTRRGGGRGS